MAKQDQQDKTTEALPYNSYMRKQSNTLPYNKSSMIEKTPDDLSASVTRCGMKWGFPSGIRFINQSRFIGQY